MTQNEHQEQLRAQMVQAQDKELFALAVVKRCVAALEKAGDPTTPSRPWLETLAEYSQKALNARAVAESACEMLGSMKS